MRRRGMMRSVFRGPADCREDGSEGSRSRTEEVNGRWRGDSCEKRRVGFQLEWLWWGQKEADRLKTYLGPKMWGTLWLIRCRRLGRGRLAGDILLPGWLPGDTGTSFIEWQLLKREQELPRRWQIQLGVAEYLCIWEYPISCRHLYVWVWISERMPSIFYSVICAVWSFDLKFF